MTSVSAYKPKLFISEIQDIFIRRNFELLDEYFRNQQQLLNFKFFELNFSAAQSLFNLAHGLGVKPLDVIVTHFSGDATSVTFRYDLFTDKNVVLDTVGGGCTVRFLVGINGATTSKGADSLFQPQSIHS